MSDYIDDPARAVELEKQRNAARVETIGPVDLVVGLRRGSGDEQLRLCASFLRIFANHLRSGRRWDTPGTMAAAIDQVATRLYETADETRDFAAYLDRRATSNESFDDSLMLRQLRDEFCIRFGMTSCVWTKRDDVYGTTCRQEFAFDDDGTPLDHHFVVCPFCARHIELAEKGD